MRKSYNEFRKKLLSGTLYFVNSFEDVAFKSVMLPPAYFMKPRGKGEYEVVIGNTVLTDALLEHNETTKEEYDNF